MQGKVEICGVNTAKLKVLKSEEMRELLIRSHDGDKEAREKLIAGNLRLVLSVIQRFGNRGENPDDLFQVGCIGLMKAIDHFDVSQGVQFSTYGVPMTFPWGRSGVTSGTTARSGCPGRCGTTRIGFSRPRRSIWRSTRRSLLWTRSPGFWSCAGRTW